MAIHGKSKAIIYVILLILIVTYIGNVFLNMGINHSGTQVVADPVRGHRKSSGTYEDGDIHADNNEQSSRESKHSIMIQEHGMLTQDDAINLFHNVDFSKELRNSVEGSPFDPLPEYKTPCWKSRLTDVEPYDNRGPFLEKSTLKMDYRDTMRKLYSDRLRQGVNWRLRCFPYFMLIGVMKSGTTDVSNRIITHPEIFPSAVKEPCFWVRYRMRLNLINATFHEYADYFDLAAEQIQRRKVHRGSGVYYPGVTFEGTPHYLTTYADWQQIPGNAGQSEPRYILADTIKALRPTMKFLVILRNPVDRLYSHFKMVHKSTKNTPILFDTTVRLLMDVWTKCMENSTERACAYGFDKLISGERTDLVASIYYIFLNDWFKVFDRSQFHVVRGEDYYADSSGELNKIYKFIGVRQLEAEENRFVDELDVKNSRMRDAILPKTRMLLESFFRPFNVKLAKLLKDPKYLWK